MRRCRGTECVRMGFAPTVTRGLLREAWDRGRAGAGGRGVPRPVVGAAREPVQAAGAQGRTDEDLAVLLELQAAVSGYRISAEGVAVDDGLGDGGVINLNAQHPEAGVIYIAREIRPRTAPNRGDPARYSVEALELVVDGRVTVYLELSAIECRHVHGKTDLPAREEVDQKPRSLNGDRHLCFFGGGTQVRRDQDVRMVHKRVVGRRRLRVEHVDRRTRDVARIERGGERLLVDQAAPGTVENARAGLHDRQLPGADEVLGIG